MSPSGSAVLPPMTCRVHVLPALNETPSINPADWLNVIAMATTLLGFVGLTATASSASLFGRTLTSTFAGLLDGCLVGEGEQRIGVAAESERLPRGAETAPAEQGGARRPGGAVAVDPRGAQLRADGDQLGEVGDGLDLAQARDADEPVR